MSADSPSISPPARSQAPSWLWAMVACVGVGIVLRCLFLDIYPLPAVDEGFWNLEAKDALRFGDADMNALYQNLRSPLHFLMTYVWGWLFTPDLTAFRALMCVAGITSIFLSSQIASQLFKQDGMRWMVVLASLSFCLIMCSRRAYLESMVGFWSLLAFWLSCRKGMFSMIALAFGVAALLLYKLNAIYVLPALALPMVHWADRRAWIKGTAFRCLAILGGILLTTLCFYVVYRIKPDAFRATWEFELTKGQGKAAQGMSVGRFALHPETLIAGMKDLLKFLPDIVLAWAAALVLLLVRLRRLSPGELKLGMWLLAGLAFLFLQTFQHMQYFLPLAWPALLLVAGGLGRFTTEGSSRVQWLPISAIALVTLLGLTRLARGAYQANLENPLHQMAQYVEQTTPADGTLLTSPEMAIMTSRRAYVVSARSPYFHFNENGEEVSESLEALRVTHLVTAPESSSTSILKEYTDSPPLCRDLTLVRSNASGAILKYAPAPNSAATPARQ